MRIHEVLAGKQQHSVVTVRPDATVQELVGLLAEHNIGALVVSVDGSRVDGIVSERDVVRRLHEQASVLEAPVSSIMSTDVHSCAATDTVDEVMALMTLRRIRHVPVVRDGALSGIVSIGDVVKSRMGQLEFERDQLDSYVQGSNS
jgi:CBS domain-containing protein